jgi:hypothetical protein
METVMMMLCVDSIPLTAAGTHTWGLIRANAPTHHFMDLEKASLNFTLKKLDARAELKVWALKDNIIGTFLT